MYDDTWPTSDDLLLLIPNILRCALCQDVVSLEATYEVPLDQPQNLQRICLPCLEETL